MPFREIIAVYCENHKEHTKKKVQCIHMLKQVVQVTNTQL
jgi:hypothetical protein